MAVLEATTLLLTLMNNALNNFSIIGKKIEMAMYNTTNMKTIYQSMFVHPERLRTSKLSPNSPVILSMHHSSINGQ